MNRETLKHRAKGAALSALHRTGMLERRVSRRSTEAALILAYHRVAPRSVLETEVLMPGMYVSAETLSAQLGWLTSRYKMVTLTALVDALDEGGWREPLCAITFDDGWHDNLQHALPVLRRWRVPATVFPVGNRVGCEEPNGWDMCFEIAQRIPRPGAVFGHRELDALFAADIDGLAKAGAIIRRLRLLSAREYDLATQRLRDYYYSRLDAVAINPRYRMLSWADMRVMQQAGIEFGYHTRNHYMLTRVAAENLRAELEWPPEAAANGIRIAPILCYPDGRHDRRVVEAARDVGYRAAVALSPGFNDRAADRYALRRFNIHEGGAGDIPRFLGALAFPPRPAPGPSPLPA